MFVPFAHPGHWLAELLYVAPVLIIGGWIGIRSLLDKREERRTGADPAQPDQDSRSSSAMS